MAGDNPSGHGEHGAPEPGAVVLAPPIDETGGCLPVTRPPDPDTVACLTVAVDGTVDRVIDRWRTRWGELPGELGVVSVDATTRGAAAAPGVHDLVEHGDGVTSTIVRDPSDLTQLGFRTSRCLGELEAGEHDDLVVCFDSLTGLLRFCDIESVFRFLHVLFSRLREAGARSHVHYDSAQFDERTDNILNSVVDGWYHDTTTDDSEAEGWPDGWMSADDITDSS